MATLREITEDLQALEDLLAELGGDVSDIEAEQAIDAWLEENSKNLKAKLDGYCTIIDQKLLVAGVRRAEATRLMGLARTDENVAEKLKSRLLYFFLSRPDLGGKIETPLHKIGVQGNGGARPVHFFEASRPETYFGWNDGDQPPFVKVKYEWDVDAIRKYLEDGNTLPFATLGERGVHLRIR